MSQEELTATTRSLQGLTDQEAAVRRANGQGNDAELNVSRSYSRILRDNLLTLFNIVLFSISVVLLILGSPRDAFFTASVALMNVIIATSQEVRAKSKLDHISLLTRPKATVIRDGQERVMDPSEVVLGDILMVGAGDQIIVDGEVAGDGRMDVDESLLTGESDLVPKKVGDPVFSGSFCVNGRAAYEAQKVGIDSFANKLTEGARIFVREYTPLQREVDLIIRILLLVVIFFGSVIAISYFINEDATMLDSVRSASVVFGLAPSSLFLTIVVAYALGAVRILDKGALVQQANSVESICHVTVLCLDKTGTLTTNQMRLDEIEPLDGLGLTEEQLRVRLGTFARSLSGGTRTSDAIADICEGLSLPTGEEIPFSSARGWSAVSFEQGELQGIYVLGAPEVLLPALNSQPDLNAYAESKYALGFRVLLFAYRPEPVPLHDATGDPRLPLDLIPLSLLSFHDQLRPEARQTLDDFSATGIELKIISGDNPQTVAAIARQVGLEREDKPIKSVSGLDLVEMEEEEFVQTALNTTIFGRITPDQKEKLVRVLRERGHYVAMTGDGVNDVLALKQANVGIAMQSGSQASRSVSDIILLQDSFAALPKAFIEGQRILNGMEDILRLYMTRIVSLVLLIATFAMLEVGFPFTPSQSSIISILVLSLPAFALAIWSRPGPVRRISITRRLIHFVMPASVTMSAAGLAVYLYFIITTEDAAYAQMTLTYVMILIGLLLVIFVEPPSEFWVGGDVLSGDYRPLLLAIGLLALFIIALVVPQFRDFYGLTLLRQPIDYVIVVSVTVIWMFGLRHIWRRRLIDRYLHISLTAVAKGDDVLKAGS
jgi:cation-transporting ATPase E